MNLMIRILIASALLAILGFGAMVAVCDEGQQCLFLPVVTSQPEVSAEATPTPAAPVPTPNGAPFVGLAIIGDSTQDEYSADNPRGEEYAATTRNWVELLVEQRGINLGAWGTRDEPRRSGYAYNWARSGATTGQLLYWGQHTGTAEQARAGEVSHVVIQIGINDFYYGDVGIQIYQGLLTGDALKQHLDIMAENIRTAIRTLKEPGTLTIMLASTQDYVTLPIVPELMTQFSDPSGQQNMVDATAYLNAQLLRIAAEEGIIYFDFNAAYMAELTSRIDSEGYLVVGSNRVDLNRRGNAPEFGLLDDQYVHPGTVLSALFSNVYIRAFNQLFGTDIAPLSDDEIQRAAGMTP